MPVPTNVAPDLPKPLELPLSQEQLDRINAYLSPLTPEDILAWALEHLPGLYQTTAFGLTGCATTDMLTKLPGKTPELIFVDTLYHFKETYELVDAMREKYGVKVHVYKPEGCETVADFEKKYGEKLWEKDEVMYDYAVKVRSLSFAVIFSSQPSNMLNRSSPLGARTRNLAPSPSSLVVARRRVPLAPLCSRSRSTTRAY
jgi:phosphoadenosine phosphosulfate reductase